MILSWSPSQNVDLPFWKSRIKGIDWHSRCVRLWLRCLGWRRFAQPSAGWLSCLVRGLFVLWAQEWLELETEALQMEAQGPRPGDCVQETSRIHGWFWCCLLVASCVVPPARETKGPFHSTTFLEMRRGMSSRRRRPVCGRVWFGRLRHVGLSVGRCFSVQ